MENVISEERVQKYFKITEEAFAVVRENVIPGREIDATEIIDMVANYVSDAHHFFDSGDLVNAFAALNYAHGWIDSGVRLDVFDVGDNDRLFTIK
ncbi:MAG: hypothetical protein ACI83O_000858 [Patescibacteria group bacterium]|jgi:hypothetical protein